MLGIDWHGVAVRWVSVFAVISVIGMSPRPAAARIIDEVWVGGMAHDISDTNGKESGTADVEFEIDSVRPAFLRFLGAPRFNVVAAVNSAGKTNYGGAGLIWDHQLFSRLYGSLQIGVAQTDGVTNPAPGPPGDYDRAHRLLLGSKTLFREAAGVNWRMSDRWMIGGEYVHLSNGQILGHGHNEGVNDLGLRIGYRFP